VILLSIFLGIVLLEQKIWASACESLFSTAQHATLTLSFWRMGCVRAHEHFFFGDEPSVKPLGIYMAYLTVPRVERDTNWAVWFSAPAGRTIILRPDNKGITCAILSWASEPRGHDRLDIREQRKILREVFAEVGWEGPRILGVLDECDDIYLEYIAQVHAPQWSRGRVALVGDSGYCASPISGMGTTLSLVGAYILAGEISTNVDYKQAFANYETIMRPYVQQAQKLPPGTPSIAFPRSRLGIKILSTFLWLASSRLFQFLGKQIFSPPADKIVLPEYSTLI